MELPWKLTLLFEKGTLFFEISGILTPPPSGGLGWFF